MFRVLQLAVWLLLEVDVCPGLFVSEENCFGLINVALSMWLVTVENKFVLFNDASRAH